MQTQKITIAACIDIGPIRVSGHGRAEIAQQKTGNMVGNGHIARSVRHGYTAMLRTRRRSPVTSTLSG